MHTYRKKSIVVLFYLLIVFFIISIFSYVQIRRKVPILNLGLSYYTEDILILSLSVLSMIKVVYEIYEIEHHHEYERRLKNSAQICFFCDLCQLYFLAFLMGFILLAVFIIICFDQLLYASAVCLIFLRHQRSFHPYRIPHNRFF